MKKTPIFSLTKKDFIISYFSGTGAGGQHRNRHMNCVRITHPASGIAAVGQTSRSREANIKTAFTNLCNNKKFLLFCAIKAKEIENNETLEEKVEKMMTSENLMIEYKKENSWEK
jgi:protein subunit release factor B